MKAVHYSHIFILFADLVNLVLPLVSILNKYNINCNLKNKTSYILLVYDNKGCFN